MNSFIIFRQIEQYGTRVFVYFILQDGRQTVLTCIDYSRRSKWSIAPRNQRNEDAPYRGCYPVHSSEDVRRCRSLLNRFQDFAIHVNIIPNVLKPILLI